MQNVETLHNVKLPLPLPTAPQLPVLTTLPSPTLHTVHRSDTAILTITSFPLPTHHHQLPNHTTSTSHAHTQRLHRRPISTLNVNTQHPTTPTALLPLSAATDDTLLLALRSGQVYLVKPSLASVVLLADVNDDDHHHHDNDTANDHANTATSSPIDTNTSGVLAAALSPDARSIAMVSPVSIILLNTHDFSTLAEYKLPRTVVHAAVSWKVDNQYVAVVARDIHCRIVAYTMDRHFDKVNAFDVDNVTIDPNADLHNMAVVTTWEPRIGGAIAVSGPDNRVTFFEPNGQRHKRKDFSIVANKVPPKILRWLPGARFLAIVTEEHEDQLQGDGWRVALYTHFNYRWYCKKRLSFQHRVIDVIVENEDQGMMYVVTECDVFRFSFFQHNQPHAMLSSSASMCVAAVVDENEIILTDFHHAIVPPPLAHAKISCNEDVQTICAMRDGTGIGALTLNGIFEWFTLDVDYVSGEKGKNWLNGCKASFNPPELWECRRHKKKLFIQTLVDSDEDSDDLNSNNGGALYMRMPIMPSKSCVVVVAPESLWKDANIGVPNDALYLFPLQQDEHIHIHEHSSNTAFRHHDNTPAFVVKEAARLPVDGGRIVAVGHASEDLALLAVTSNGALLRVQVDEYAGKLTVTAVMDAVPTSINRLEEVRTTAGRALTVVLANDGRLDVFDLAGTRRIAICKDASSYAVHEGFLMFTTRSNLLYCVLLDSCASLRNAANRSAIPSIADLLDAGDASLPFVDLNNNHGIVRPIDRGSILVAPVAGKTDVILQAPRGNLETIAPRPIVYEVVNKLTRAGRYAEAFDLCRKQRVDMNHVVNDDFDAFIANVNDFVLQIVDPAHLSIFMTFLTGTDNDVNRVCKAITNRLFELQSECDEMNAKVHMDSSSQSKNENGDTSDSNSNKINDDKNNVNGDSTNSNSNNNNNNSSNNNNNSSSSIGSNQKNNNIKINNSSSVNYVSAILTGMMRQTPRDFSGALKQIEALRKSNRITEAGAAVDYLFVLVKDEQRVYEEALGVYDLTLSAFVAECSQLDPQVYIKELHTLRNIDNVHERRHLIDMRLQRYDSALRHLHLMGKSRHTDCIALIQEHNLYDVGLPLFPGHVDLLHGYARHLKDDKRQFAQAAAVFVRLTDWPAAIDCYRLQNRWQPALYAIAQAPIPAEEKRTLHTAVADDLADIGLAVPCARIRAHALGDVDGALDVLATHEEWDTAFELTHLHPAPERKAILARLVTEAAHTLLATLRENSSKLRERGARFAHLQAAHERLRNTMTAGGGANASTVQGGDVEGADSDVFSATSASSIGSNLSDVTFTCKSHSVTTSLYASSTAPGPLSAAKLDRAAAKRRARASKKRIREGHPNEREYLVGYLKKLTPSQFIRDRVSKTVDALLLVGNHNLAASILAAMANLVEQALALPDHILGADIRLELNTDRKWEAFAHTFKLAAPPTPASDDDDADAMSDQ